MNLVLDILAVIAAGISLHQFFTRKLYPGKLVFVEEASIELFSAIVKRFPEIKVRYGGSPVKSNLVLLVGSVINKGIIDIETREGEDKLQIQVPEGFRWVMVRAVRRSPSLKLVTAINERSLVFDFKLLKKGEAFRFEAICEVEEDFSPSFLLSAVMKFHHRIPQTGRVYKVRSVPRSELVRMSREANFAALLLFLLISLGLSMAALDYLFWNSGILYRYKSEGKILLVEISPGENGAIVAKGIDEKFREEISPQDIRRAGKLTPFVGKRPFKTFFFKWFDRFEYVLLLVGIRGAMGSSIYVRHQRERRSIWEKTESI